ncbi:MAG: YbjN domain-containing protein [Verrucomicrobiales bacterium]
MSDSPLFISLTRVLRQQGWEYQRVEGQEVARLDFQTRSGAIPVIVQAFAPIGALGVTSEPSWTAPRPPPMGKLAELLMRVNLQLTIGNFEIDWDEARIYFRLTNILPENTNPPASMVAGLVHTAVTEADRMNYLLRELARCPDEELERFDIGRLLRRDDVFPISDG